MRLAVADGETGATARAAEAVAPGCTRCGSPDLEESAAHIYSVSRSTGNAIRRAAGAPARTPFQVYVSRVNSRNQ